MFDLLNQDSSPDLLKETQGLRIRWTKKEQFIVENLFVFECHSAEEALELFNLGLKNKVVAAHNLNHQSSRSHCIFTLTVESVD